MAAWTSPGRVVGLPSTPPRRTNWIPTSPSPLRKSFTSTLKSNDNSSEEEDDEELLQLKLAQIQTKLALKKAQKRKRQQMEEETKTNSSLQVVASPPPTPKQPPPPVSPQRILLGLDRGKKATDVSLKNPWKPPTQTPPKPKSTFADRLTTAIRTTKAKSKFQESRDSQKSKSFSVTGIAARLTNPTTDDERIDEWDKYTGFNLRTRVLSLGVLSGECKGKTVYSVSDLYRLVTPPMYEPPEYDTPDFLVTGIVAAKSPVRQIKGSGGGNYLHDIDLFLFGSAFSETWKLQRGMVVIILNPGILKRKDGKGFNLRLNENKTPIGRKQPTPESEIEGGESVLEVGFAKDFGTCEALRADGTSCSDWVDTRHTKVCEYHIDQGMKRARKGRMEYAVGMRAFSPKKDKEGRNPFAPKKINTKEPTRKRLRTSEPDRWDGGGGSVFHSSCAAITPINDLDSTVTSKKHIDGIKRDLKGSERERELRRVFKSFAPPKPAPRPVEEEKPPAAPELPESKAFDAKRVRVIGFDPRRRADEEPRLRDGKISPIRGKISMDGVLSGMNSKSTVNEMDSDSDSDLDIVMD